MFQGKSRRFRRRSNGRGRLSGRNGQTPTILRFNSFSNDQTRNKFRAPQSAEKLFEKYNTLAKEAMSLGDKTLSENYLQHADHFMRIIEDKNKNQNLRKPDPIHKPAVDGKDLSQKNDINPDRVSDNKK